MLFAPAASQPEASAVEDNSGISTYAVTPTVGISLPASIDFADVLPTPSGATTTATADLTITTIDSAGYSLYLYSSDGDNSLRPKISSLANISQINATAGDVGLTLSSLEPNTWGYNLGTSAPTDATKYSAVPTDNSTPIQTKDTSDTNSANDTYMLSFGAKVDTTTASGAYSDTLTIAVVAEPPLITDMTSLSTMQEMTPEVCEATEVGTVARLADARDQKQYWVTKLADGNCWMTQNLDLDLTNGTPLTPEDSDVSSNWNPPRSTEPAGTITSANTNTETYSWDLGMYVKSDPDGYSDYCNQVKGLSDPTCTSAGWTDVSSMTPMADGASNEAIPGSTYNAHYLVGNLYQWNVATAGTGGADAVGEDATDSICPKGWQLPTSNNSNSGSFQALMTAYSISSNTAGSTAITQSPLYFNPSGRVYSGSLWRAGSGGNYWSSTALSSASRAYYLYFNSGNVYPSDINYRYDGLSVRCLASQ